MIDAIDFNAISAQSSKLLQASQHNIAWVIGFIAVLWAVQLLNFLVRYRLNVLGIYPRHLFGLVGIPCSTFLHGNFEHLFFNTIPLFLLTSLIILKGPYACLGISLSIILLHGIGVWLFGRKGLHVGASGLIMGYWGYLLANAWHEPGVVNFLVGLVCVYYLGSLFFSLFPREEKVSFEGHIFGFLAGITTLYCLPDVLAWLSKQIV